MNAQAKQVEVIEHDAAEPSRAVAMTPMAMLDRAIATGASVDVLTKLMELHERWERNQARKAFDNAMAAASAEIPVIIKNRKVDFTGKTGIRTNYVHEDLAEIIRVIKPILGKHGLSHRFRSSSPVGEPITVTCIISHRDGYSEENTLIGPRDESGNKNNIQAIGSTITYLERYTLKAALGLAASNDDDGRASSGDDKPVSEEQLLKLDETIKAVGANKEKLLKLLKVESLEALPASRFDEVIAELKLFDERRKAKAAS